MKKPSVEQQIIQGLESLATSLEKDEDVPIRDRYRTLRLEIKPARYSPALVKKTRSALRLNQSLFARFLGISLGTLQAWERGTKSPEPVARRFMDEIRREPERWRARIGELMSNGIVQ